MSKKNTKKVIKHVKHDGQYQMRKVIDDKGKEKLEYLHYANGQGKGGPTATLMGKCNDIAETIEWTRTNHSGYTGSADDAKYQAPKLAEALQELIQGQTGSKGQVAIEVIRAACPGLRDSSKKKKDGPRFRPCQVIPAQGRKGVIRVYVHGNTERAQLGSVLAWAAHIIMNGQPTWSVKGGQDKKSPGPLPKMDVVGIGEVTFKDYASYLAFLASQTKFTMNTASVDACEAYRENELGKKVDDSLKAYNKVSMRARKARRDERRLNGTRGGSRSTVHTGVAA